MSDSIRLQFADVISSLGIIRTENETSFENFCLRNICYRDRVRRRCARDGNGYANNSAVEVSVKDQLLH
jgi:hypothetical protein